MRLLQTVGAIILAAGVALSGASAYDVPDAREAVRAFYAAYYETEASGLPSSADMVVLAPWLGEKLQGAIAEARLFQADYMAKYPKDKPPFCEGDFFSSLFEGPTSFDVGEATASDDFTLVDLLFEYRDPYAGSGDAREPFRWKDRAVLAREDGRYVLVDVELLGDWAFKSGNSLSGILKSR